MNSYISNLYFNNFDHVSEVVKKWDLECFQLIRGPADIILSQLISSETSFAHFSSSCPFRLLGAPPHQMWTIMLSTQNMTSKQWLLNGRLVPENAITIYSPGYDFNNAFHSTYECYSFSVSHVYLEQLCDELELYEFIKTLKGKDIFTCPVAMKKRVWRRVMEYKRWLDSVDELISDQTIIYRSELEREILRDIILIVAEYASNSVNCKYSCIPNLLASIDEYFETHPFENMSVQDLCKITGIKERTLQYNFKTQLGVSPKHYIKALRLNKVRKELVGHHHKSFKINEIAHKYGFWHMGQFAADYKALFGELPSETLINYCSN